MGDGEAATRCRSGTMFSIGLSVGIVIGIAVGSVVALRIGSQTMDTMRNLIDRVSGRRNQVNFELCSSRPGEAPEPTPQAPGTTIVNAVPPPPGARCVNASAACARASRARYRPRPRPRTRSDERCRHARNGS